MNLLDESLHSLKKKHKAKNLYSRWYTTTPHFYRHGWSKHWWRQINDKISLPGRSHSFLLSSTGSDVSSWHITPEEVTFALFFMLKKLVFFLYYVTVIMFSNVHLCTDHWIAGDLSTKPEGVLWPTLGHATALSSAPTAHFPVTTSRAPSARRSTTDPAPAMRDNKCKNFGSLGQDDWVGRQHLISLLT